MNKNQPTQHPQELASRKFRDRRSIIKLLPSGWREYKSRLRKRKNHGTLQPRKNLLPTSSAPRPRPRPSSPSNCRTTSSSSSWPDVLLRQASSPVALSCSGHGGRRIRAQNSCAAKISDSPGASTSVGRLLSFVPVISTFIDNLPVGSYFITAWYWNLKI